MFRVLGAIAILLCLVPGAEARHRKIAIADPGCNVVFPCEGVVPSARGEAVVRAMHGFGSAQKVYAPRAQGTIVAHPAGCPATAFCGCGAAVRVFGAPIRALWLAANWFRFPRAAPAPGMVAVRRHHVMVLEADLGGGVWRVYDANSGRHLTRIHARSIAPYTIVDPHA